MPHQCCVANMSLSCADCPGECCDPAKTGNWKGLASTHNYKNYFGKDWIYCSLNSAFAMASFPFTVDVH